MLAHAPMMTVRGGDGDDPPPPVVQCLHPQAIGYNTVFTDGSGSGEFVKVQLNATKMTYRITYLASPIPVETGTVAPMRDTAPSSVQTGMLTQETALSTEELNRCTFHLNNADLGPSRPARFFLGLDMLGDIIPGATTQFDNIVGVGKIVQTTFPYHPPISFSSTETDLTRVTGSYNQPGYHQVPSQNFSQRAVDARSTINADDIYTECGNLDVKNDGTCLTSSTMVNQKLTLRGDVSAFTALNHQPQIPAAVSLLDPAKAGKSTMIVGRLYDQPMPIFICVGAANSDLTTGPPVADDESSISIMTPIGNITQGSQGGEYTGVDSTFNHHAAALMGAQTTILDPFSASRAALAQSLNLDFTQTIPGTIRTAWISMPAGSTSTGKLVFTDEASGFLGMNDTRDPCSAVSAFVW